MRASTKAACLCPVQHNVLRMGRLKLTVGSHNSGTMLACHIRYIHWGQRDWLLPRSCAFFTICCKVCYCDSFAERDFLSVQEGCQVHVASDCTVVVGKLFECDSLGDFRVERQPAKRGQQSRHLTIRDGSCQIVAGLTLA